MLPGEYLVKPVDDSIGHKRVAGPVRRSIALPARQARRSPGKEDRLDAFGQVPLALRMPPNCFLSECRRRKRSSAGKR